MLDLPAEPVALMAKLLKVFLQALDMVAVLVLKSPAEGSLERESSVPGFKQITRVGRQCLRQGRQRRVILTESMGVPVGAQ